MIAPKRKYYECPKCGFLRDDDVEEKTEITVPSGHLIRIPYCIKCGSKVEETDLMRREF